MSNSDGRDRAWLLVSEPLKAFGAECGEINCREALANGTVHTVKEFSGG